LAKILGGRKAILFPSANLQNTIQQEKRAKLLHECSGWCGHLQADINSQCLKEWHVIEETGR
jgi:hypothetical protein